MERNNERNGASAAPPIAPRGSGCGGINDTRYITPDDLAELGLTADEVRQRCPWAIKYTALDRRPCWWREDLAELVGDPAEDDE
jgi:hypothetical protein